MKCAGGEGWERRRVWSWTILQQDMPETADALSSRASRAITSAFPTTIRLYLHVLLVLPRWLLFCLWVTLSQPDLGKPFRKDSPRHSLPVAICLLFIQTRGAGSLFSGSVAFRCLLCELAVAAAKRVAAVAVRSLSGVVLFAAISSVKADFVQ